MNRVLRIGLEYLTIGIMLFVALFAKVRGNDLFCILSLFIIMALFMWRPQKKEGKEEFDELEKTILLQASKITFAVLINLGLWLYMFWQYFSIFSSDEMAWPLKLIYVDIFFFSVFAVGCWIYAAMVLIQHIYNQSTRFLGRTSIIHAGQESFLAFLVLLATGLFLSIAAKNHFKVENIELPLMVLIAYPIGFGTYSFNRNHLLEKFTTREKAIYYKTRIAGIVTGIVFFIGVSTLFSGFSTLFHAVYLALIGYWVGSFIHAFSSLIIFCFLDIETAQSIAGDPA